MPHARKQLVAENNGSYLELGVISYSLFKAVEEAMRSPVLASHSCFFWASSVARVMATH